MSKTEYQLTQHSILIHFHAKHEDGLNVCLRASEVKPKLDRFLVKKYGKPIPPGWIRSKNVNGADTALKYRMTITCNGNDTIIYESGTKENRHPENKLPAIFYGNMNAKGSDVKYGVFFKSGLTLTVICFIPELSEFIEKNIAAFFAVTNFGTMQDKGFGSFTVKGKEGITAKELKEYYDIAFADISDMLEKAEELDALDDLKNGEVSEETTKKVQDCLNKLQLPVGEVDGYCGERTIIMVKRFQKLYGYEPADGVIDDEVVAQLQEEADKAAPPQEETQSGENAE